MTVLRWTMMATQVPPGGSLGGIVRYTIEFTRALAARDDVLVSAVTSRAAAETMRDLVGPAGQVHTVADLPGPVTALAERYAPVPALRGGCDVVHGVKHLVPRRSSALRVLTVHDMLLLDRPGDFGPVKRHLLPGPYLASIDDADLLLCVSDATRDRVVAHDAAARERLSVVPLAAAPLSGGEPTPVPSLAGRRFALVVGDPTPRKNLRTVITAWGGVRAAHPDACLAIAGPPSWGRTEVGPAYRRLVDDGSLVPLGQLADSELRWAYENATVVLCPSLAEGFGLPALEALDAGAPVIISDDAAMREVSGERAWAIVPALNLDGWISAIVDAFSSSRPDRRGHRVPRTWDDVAEDSVACVRAALARRAHLRGEVILGREGRSRSA